MAKKTKAQKAQEAKALLDAALADNKLTKDEIKSIKGADRGTFDTYAAGLLDQVKSGDPNAINLLGGSDLDFGKSIFNDKSLKGTPYNQFGANILKAAAKDRPIDFSFSPEQNKLAAMLYQASGDGKLVDPRWAAEAAGKNSYIDAQGNPQLTSLGEKAQLAGLDTATNLDDYTKSFFNQNMTSFYVNPDGSLTDFGKQKFNDFWRSSGIPDRAKALDAFQQQVNPLYKSTQPAADAAKPNSDVNLPKNMSDLPDWSIDNLMPKTFSPLSNETKDALEATADEAKKNIAAGDRNAPFRDEMLDIAKNGGAPDNPYMATASKVDPASNAYINPYTTAYQTLDMRDFMPTVASHASTTLSDDSGQIDTSKIKSYAPGVSDAFTADASLIDTNQIKKADVANSTAYLTPSTQIDLSKYQRADAPTSKATQATASLVDRSKNPYLDKTVAPISFNELNKFAGMNNPYLQSVIDYATSDIARTFNNNVQNSTDALMARSGAFGGSAWAAAQAENNRQYANELGRTVGGMRMTDFQKQQDLEEARINRLKEIAIQNQLAQLEDLKRNAGLYGDMATEDARNLTDVSKFNTGEQNTAFRQDANNAWLANKNFADTYNAGINKNADLMQGDNQYNATALTDVSNKNADRITSVNRDYAKTWNDALGSNATALTDVSKYNATNNQNNSENNANRVDAANKAFSTTWNAALGANANNAMNNAQWNAGAENTTSENNAKRDTDAFKTTADDWNTWKTTDNAGLNANAKDNTTILNSALATNAKQWNDTLASNAAADTDVSKFTAGKMFDYWDTGNKNRIAGAVAGNAFGDSTVYDDIGKLAGVGGAKEDYATKIIGENNASWNAQNGWDQVQNDNLGNTVNAAGGLNNSSTSTVVNPYQNGTTAGNVGGMVGSIGALLANFLKSGKDPSTNSTYVPGYNPYESVFSKPLW